MTPRTCPRCHSALLVEDANTLVFCSHCGAPQVTLSEELQEQAAQQQAAALHPDAPPAFFPDTTTDPTGVLWSLVIQLAGLAGVVIITLLLATLAVPAFSLFTLLWIVGAPIILLGVYCSRKPFTRVTTGFGAQFGLLTGLAIATGAAICQTVTAVVIRFVLHRGSILNAGFNNAFVAMNSQMIANPNSTADPATIHEFQHWLTIPEFRLGFMISGALLFLCMYLLYTSIAGAFAGFLRSRAAKQ